MSKEQGGAQMKTYAGGEQVKNGIYWNTHTWEFVPVAKPAGALPGGTDNRFLRAPMPMVMIAGPLMGLAYFIFLPIVGPAMLLVMLGKKAAGLMRRAVTPVATSALPSWVPGVSYLARRAAGQKKAVSSEQLPEDPHIEKLEKEVRQRRDHGEK
jgi:hypothetical protein